MYLCACGVCVFLVASVGLFGNLSEGWYHLQVKAIQLNSCPSTPVPTHHPCPDGRHQAPLSTRHRPLPQRHADLLMPFIIYILLSYLYQGMSGSIK